MYLSLIEIILRQGLVAGYRPPSKRGKGACGDTDPEMPLQTKGAGQITERFPFLKAKDVKFVLAIQIAMCILYV